MKIPSFFIHPRTRLPGANGPSTLSYSALCCTRCNGCATSCPSYLLQREEIFSPRGRAQLTRLLAEDKIKPLPYQKLIKQTLRHCTLCARCTQDCAGKIPVPHQMITIRRSLKLRLLPHAFYYAHCLRVKTPVIFNSLVRFALLLRYMAITTLLLPVLPNWLRHLCRVLPRKTTSLRRVLATHHVEINSPQPDVLYLPGIEAQHIDGKIGFYTLQAAKAQRPLVLFNTPSGLFEYTHGSFITCLKQAKKLLRTWEKYSTQKPLALLTESIEIYSFLKNYPLLFATLPGWQKRATAFAAHVKFTTDFPFPDGKMDDTKHCVALDDSTALYPAGEVAERARKILLTKFGPNMIQCTYSRFPVPVAGGAFAYPAQAQWIVQQNARDVAQHQLTDVYCLSAWAALEINAALRRYHPAATAKHIAYLQADYERLSDGNA